MKKKEELASVYDRPDPTSAIAARLQVGVVAQVKKCTNGWGRVIGNGTPGSGGTIVKLYFAATESSLATSSSLAGGTATPGCPGLPISSNIFSMPAGTYRNNIRTGAVPTTA